MISESCGHGAEFGEFICLIVYIYPLLSGSLAAVILYGIWSEIFSMTSDDMLPVKSTCDIETHSDVPTVYPAHF